LTLNDICLFPTIKSSLKGWKFQDIEDIPKKVMSTESYSTTDVPKMLPPVAALLG
jgi:hypothetical protein